MDADEFAKAFAGDGVGEGLLNQEGSALGATEAALTSFRGLAGDHYLGESIETPGQPPALWYI